MAAIDTRQRGADQANAAPSSESRRTGEPGTRASAPARTNAHRREREAIKFFTIAEVAEKLSVSTRTVRRWIERGELVAHHFGAAVRISDADLRAFSALHRDG
jgi:excisionase family DNA binding protein